MTEEPEIAVAVKAGAEDATAVEVPAVPEEAREDKLIDEEFVEDPLETEKSPENMDTEEPVVQKGFPMREITWGPLRFNWLVSISGLGVLWGVAIFCMVSTDANAELGKWYDTVIVYFTWFYILGKTCCV